MALEIALQNADPELLRLFLKHGGNPNIIAKKNYHKHMKYNGTASWYPIHKAVRDGNVECLKMLLGNPDSSSF